MGEYTATISFNDAIFEYIALWITRAMNFLFPCKQIIVGNEKTILQKVYNFWTVCIINFVYKVGFTSKNVPDFFDRLIPYQPSTFERNPIYIKFNSNKRHIETIFKPQTTHITKSILKCIENCENGTYRRNQISSNITDIAISCGNHRTYITQQLKTLICTENTITINELLYIFNIAGNKMLIRHYNSKETNPAWYTTTFNLEKIGDLSITQINEIIDAEQNRITNATKIEEIDAKQKNDISNADKFENFFSKIFVTGNKDDSESLGLAFNIFIAWHNEFYGGLKPSIKEFTNYLIEQKYVIEKNTIKGIKWNGDNEQ